MSSSQNSTEKHHWKFAIQILKRLPIHDTPIVLTIQIYITLEMFCRNISLLKAFWTFLNHLKNSFIAIIKLKCNIEIS